MSLSLLSILLGLGFAIPNLIAVVKPEAFRAAVRRFPRSNPWGYALMGLGTLWFLHNLRQETISDFAAYKPVMIVGFAAIGIGACLYVRDFLAVRGLSVVLLLLAKLTLDSARWVDSPWRLVLVLWAYLWIFAGIWFTVSPWRLRDFLSWATANERRVRIGGAGRAAFGLFVALLGIVAF